MAKRTCSIEGCERPASSRGWCQTHYSRWRAHGDPMTVKTRGPAKEQLAWIMANYQAEPDGPCVLWPFALNERGYGLRIRGLDGKFHQPHVIALELRDGPAPEGMEARHMCKAKHCIGHVVWGSRVENMQDKVRDGTDNRGEKNYNTKITADQVREVRRIAADGSSYEDIARSLDMCASAISAIVRRKSWAWLD